MKSIKIVWEMISAETKESISAETKESVLDGEFLNEIAGEMVTLFKTQFIGVDYFNSQDTKRRKKYNQALYSLELVDICLDMNTLCYSLNIDGIQESKKAQQCNFFSQNCQVPG